MLTSVDDPPVMENRYYTVDEVAKAISMSAKWVRQECAAGRMPHSLIGRRYRFTEADVQALFAANHVAAQVYPDLAPARARR